MNHYVYEITNLINGKKYIGKRSCKCPIEEDKYMGSGKLLKKAIDKYGKENFKKDVLQICESEEMAFEWEKVYIEQVKAYDNINYYNISSGGDGGRGNFITKTESELNEIYLKISNTQKGRFKGHKNPRARKVVCINTGKVFNTIKDASNEYKTAESCIRRCCSGQSESYGGQSKNPISFMYYDEYILLSDEEINIKVTNLKSNTYKTQKRKVILLNTKKVFDALGDASKFIGKSVGTVCIACRNRERSAGKINGEPALWMYYDEYLKMSNKEIESIFLNYKKSKNNKIKLQSSKIICLNNGEIFEKIKDAELKYSINNISANCRGKIKYAGKINGEPARWMYYEDYLKLQETEI